MRRSRLPLVLALVVVMAACSTEMSLRQLTEAEQAINNRLNTWVRALNNSELDTLLLMHHRVPEVTVILADGSEAVGWEAEENLWRDFFAGFERINVNMLGPEIEILSPEFAITTFRHTTDIMRDETTRDPPAAGHVTIVWVMDRMDNEWKIHLTHMSYKPPSEN